MQFNKRFILLLGVAIFAIYVILQLCAFHTVTEYDHDRDLIITQELVQRGTFSYFGQAYVINPPLNYVIHTIPIWLAGNLAYFWQQMIEIILFTAGISFIYFIALEILKDQKQALVALFLAAISWTFVLATAIRSYGIVLLMGSLLLLTYLKYLSKPSNKNAIIFGLIVGLAMLTKSVLLFLIAIIGLHFLITALIKKDFKIYHIMLAALLAAIVYAPYLIYVAVNGLPWPWQANLASLSAAWTNGARIPPWQVYLDFFKTWPVLLLASLAAIILQFKSERKSILSSHKLLLILAVLVTPFLIPMVLRLTALNHWFYLFIPLPILSAYLVGRAGKFAKPLLIILVVALLITGAFQISQNVAPISVYNNEELNSFVKELTPSDTILSEWRYTYFDVFSPAYSEYATQPDPGAIITLSADYYLSTKQIDLPFLEQKQVISSDIPIYKGDIFVYAVDLNSLLSSNNLTKKGTVTLVNSENKPVSYAQCQIYAENWAIPQISNRAGEISLIVPKSFASEPSLQCKAMGYEDYAGPVSDMVNLGKLNGFAHKYYNTRY